MNHSHLVSGITATNTPHHAPARATLRIEADAFQKPFGSICARKILRFFKLNQSN